MEAMYERCCGLDVHKKTVVVCLITPDPEGRPQKQVRSFGTMTEDLLRLSDWLSEARCTPVAMESTGVYWKPVWNVLEGGFTLLLVNAQHIKAVPGRKTDVRDCEWIAELLRHGLLQASMVPDQPQRELREVVRYRTALVQQRTAEVNRLQQTLEGANIKLAAVVSDILGKSAREMLEALLSGATDAPALAQLARGRLREKLPQLAQALQGRFGAHQRFLVAEQLAHSDYLEEAIGRLSAEIAERLRPFDALLVRLDALPGVARRTAEVLLAELGTDLRRFPRAAHLASWAGMCPGNHESAGKRASGKTRKGNRWLRAALVDAAHAAGRTRQTYLAAQYHRLVARRGKKKAAVAVGHSILVIVYFLLQHPERLYQDLGFDYLDQRHRQAVERHHVRRLEALGYKVALEPVA